MLNFKKVKSSGMFFVCRMWNYLKDEYFDLESGIYVKKYFLLKMCT